MRMHIQTDGRSENRTFKLIRKSFLEGAHFEALVLKENKAFNIELYYSLLPQSTKHLYLREGATLLANGACCNDATTFLFNTTFLTPTFHFLPGFTWPIPCLF